MGKAKVLKYCNNRLMGSLDEKACNTIEHILNIDAQNQGLVELSHLITCALDSEVAQYIEDMETIGCQMHHFDRNTVGTLKNYQTCGTALMYIAKNCILGDSVGLGKTVETAALYRMLVSDRENDVSNGVPVPRDRVRALMLTEKNLAAQFRSEMIKFTSEYFELVPSAEKDVMDKFIAYHPIDQELVYSIVGTHGLLSNNMFLMWLEQCRTSGAGFPFDMLVVDESSVLGNPKNQIVNNFKLVSKYFDRIIFLNATPFDTKLDIFYTQLDLLDHALLPTKTNFQKQYCIMDYRGMYPKPTGKYKNQAEFKRLIGYRYFARTRRDKGAVMEDCTGRIVLTPLSKAQKVLLSKSQLKRIIYDCPTYLDSSVEFNSENVPKLAGLIDLFNNDCADADSILIYSHFKESQKYLSKWLTSCGYSNRVLNGDTSYQERLDTIEGFKRGDFKVLVTNVQKGLNFGSCDYCIFYSFDPNPSKMIQFEGRTTREFDIFGKHIYILCSEGDEYKSFNNVIRPRAKATTQLTNSDISVVMQILTGGLNE